MYTFNHKLKIIFLGLWITNFFEKTISKRHLSINNMFYRLLIIWYIHTQTKKSKTFCISYIFWFIVSCFIYRLSNIFKSEQKLWLCFVKKIYGVLMIEFSRRWQETNFLTTKSALKYNNINSLTKSIILFNLKTKWWTIDKWKTIPRGIWQKNNWFFKQK